MAHPLPPLGPPPLYPCWSIPTRIRWVVRLPHCSPYSARLSALLHRLDRATTRGDHRPQRRPLPGPRWTPPRWSQLALMMPWPSLAVQVMRKSLTPVRETTVVVALEGAPTVALKAVAPPCWTPGSSKTITLTLLPMPPPRTSPPSPPHPLHHQGPPPLSLASSCGPPPLQPSPR